MDNTKQKKWHVIKYSLGQNDLGIDVVSKIGTFAPYLVSFYKADRISGRIVLRKVLKALNHCLNQ